MGVGSGEWGVESEATAGRAGCHDADFPRRDSCAGVTITTSVSEERWEDSGQTIFLQYRVPEFFFGVVECHRNGDTLTCGVLAGAVFVYRRVP